MSKFKEFLEMATSVCVVLGVIFVGVIFYRSFTNSGVTSPKAGDRLPQLGAYAWNSSPQTLVVAVRDGCHFCEESMPFYRKLADLKKQGRLNANLIAVLPDSAETSRKVLGSQNVDIPATPEIPLKSLNVGGTPTLILADDNGEVKKTWVGKQSKSGEQSILDAIER